MYTRLNRFNSLLLANMTYNITFNSTPPRDIHFQFQKRYTVNMSTFSTTTTTTNNNTTINNTTNVNNSNNNNDWAIIKIYYPIPNSIRVQVNDQIIDPITHI